MVRWGSRHHHQLHGRVAEETAARIDNPRYDAGSLLRGPRTIVVPGDNAAVGTKSEAFDVEHASWPESDDSNTQRRRAIRRNHPFLSDHREKQDASISDSPEKQPLSSVRTKPSAGVWGEIRGDAIVPPDRSVETFESQS